MLKLKDIPIQEVIEVIVNSSSIANVLGNLNCHDNTSNRNYLKCIIQDNSVDCSHFKIRCTKASYEANPKKCKYCGKVLPYESRRNDFCNQSCAASYNNQGVCRNGNKLPDHSYCLNCGHEIPRGNKYCNNTCHFEYERTQYINKWKSGEESGIIGKDDISNHIRNYLFEKYNNSCQLCGWNQPNPYT